MKREHAVVVGGSMAGLLAARVLADYFQRVTVIERDTFPRDPEVRKGVPQGAHVHALLAAGMRVLQQLFPGIEDELLAAGAIMGDVGTEFAFHHFGGWKLRSPIGIRGSFQSRPLLEWLVHQRVAALPHVSFRTGASVVRLTGDAHRVRGVGLADGAEVVAELVLDATGRGSRTPQWLEALGCERPKETEVKVWFGYASRLYHRSVTPAWRGGVLIFPKPPERRGGALFAIERNRWICTLGGWLRECPPLDERGYLEFASTLVVPDVYDIIRREEPLSEIRPYHVPSNHRRHYERLRRSPDGLVVMGDAIASFNPIYGQGMTVAALEAVELDGCLRARDDMAHGFPRRFWQRAARFVDAAWTLATSEDLRYPECEGHRPPGMALLQAYLERVHHGAEHDDHVLATFYRVLHMLEPPTALLAPATMVRVLAGRRARRRSVPPERASASPGA